MLPVSFLPIHSGLLPQTAMEGESRYLQDEEGVTGCEDCVVINGTCSGQSSDTANGPLIHVLEAVCTVESRGRWAGRSWGGIIF